MDRLELRESRHGRGVYALKAFSPGELILLFHGDVITEDQLPVPYPCDFDYFLQIGPGRYLGPSGGIDDFVNHSCHPNAGVLITPARVTLIAVSHIRPGDQVTFDYSLTMDAFPYEMVCLCGSKFCRHVVRNFVDLPRALQLHYERMGLVPAYIAEKMNDATRPPVAAMAGIQKTSLAGRRRDG